MFKIPKDPKKIKERIRRYKRSQKKEKSNYGCYDDGAGKRYLLGPLYLYLGNIEGARKKLLQTMFSNVYLIPHLIGTDLPELDIWHGSNWESKQYIYSVPDEFIELWDKEALEWAEQIYFDPEIQMKLQDEHNIQERRKLIDEAHKLEDLE